MSRVALTVLPVTRGHTTSSSLNTKSLEVAGGDCSRNNSEFNNAIKILYVILLHWKARDITIYIICMSKN